MLKIQRSANGEIVFKLIGRMDTEHVNELQKLFKTESHDRPIPARPHGFDPRGWRRG